MPALSAGGLLAAAARTALVGGGLFRARVADALVSAGWAIRSGTGDRGRYFEQLREQGPTVGLTRVRALVFEAAGGRLSADDAARLLARMECRQGGELLALDE